MNGPLKTLLDRPSLSAVLVLRTVHYHSKISLSLYPFRPSTFIVSMGYKTSAFIQNDRSVFVLWTVHYRFSGPPIFSVVHFEFFGPFTFTKTVHVRLDPEKTHSCIIWCKKAYFIHHISLTCQSISTEIFSKKFFICLNFFHDFSLKPMVVSDSLEPVLSS